MSLNGAMNASVSGMQGQAEKSQKISANLAASDVTGYKREYVNFLTMVTLGATAGVYYEMQRDMSQGLVQPDPSDLSLAIGGNGFFVVGLTNGTGNSPQEFFYTRNGGFYQDNQGYLRTQTGHYLMGVLVDRMGQIPVNFAGTLQEMSPINISNIKPYYFPSSTVTVEATLPAACPIGSIYNSNIPIVDSLGESHNLTLRWTKTAPMVWTATPLCPDTTSILETDASGIPYTMTVEFEIDGSLKYINGQAVTYAPNIYLNWNTAHMSATPANVALSLNIGTFGQKDGLSMAGDSFVPTVEKSDCVAIGNFTQVTFDERGLMSTHFSNGGSTPLGQLFLANFNQPAFLEMQEGGVYIETTDSGRYSLRKPKESGLGKIIPNALEMSNADNASEFTGLIQSQAAFAMNAKAAQTINEMLDVLQSIKR